MIVTSPWMMRRRAARWLLAFCAIAPAAGAQEITSLFANSELRAVELPAHAAAGPVRLGRLATEALQAGRLRIELPDGRILIVVREAAPAPDGVHEVWSGAVEGVDESTVSLTRHRDVVSGQLHVSGQTYELAPIWTGEHMLFAVNAGCRPPFESSATAADSSASAETGPVLHRGTEPRRASDEQALTVLYTPATRERWSGQGGIEARVVATVDAMNRLAHGARRWRVDALQEVRYSETGDLRSALRWLARQPPVASTSGEPGLVVLVTEDNNLCGASTAGALHALYSSCLSDAQLAAKLGPSSGG